MAPIEFGDDFMRTEESLGNGPSTQGLEDPAGGPP